jgi:hypothetical protein
MNRVIVFSMLIAFCLCGCKSGGIPGLVPAEGVVIFEGTPLVEGFITFSPKDSEGMSGTVMTDANGKFVMKTRGFVGLLPGEYAVVVLKTEVLRALTEEENEAHFAKTGQYMEPEIKAIVPERFGSIQTTPLTYTIPPKGDKNIVIDFAAKTTSADVP